MQISAHQSAGFSQLVHIGLQAVERLLSHMHARRERYNMHARRVRYNMHARRVRYNVRYNAIFSDSCL